MKELFKYVGFYREFHFYIFTYNSLLCIGRSEKKVKDHTYLRYSSHIRELIKVKDGNDEPNYFYYNEAGYFDALKNEICNKYLNLL